MRDSRSESPSRLHCMNWSGSPNRLVCRSSNCLAYRHSVNTNPDQIWVFCYRVWIAQADPNRCNMQPNTWTHKHTLVHTNIHTHWYTPIHTYMHYKHTLVHIYIVTNAHTHTCIHSRISQHNTQIHTYNPKYTHNTENVHHIIHTYPHLYLHRERNRKREIREGTHSHGARGRGGGVPTMKRETAGLPSAELGWRHGRLCRRKPRWKGKLGG